MLKRFGLAVLFAVLGSVGYEAKAWSDPQLDPNFNNSLISTVTFETSTNTPDPNEIFELVNMARASSNAPPLRANKSLGDIAAKRAKDMALRQYYAHKTPDGKYFYDLFPGYGLDPEYRCENLDLVFVPDKSQIINEWLGSTKGHRECMLNSTLIEAGYATTKLTLVDFNGNATTAYLAVAIHTTEL